MSKEDISGIYLVRTTTWRSGQPDGLLLLRVASVVTSKSTMKSSHLPWNDSARPHQNSDSFSSQFEAIIVMLQRTNAQGKSLWKLSLRAVGLWMRSLPALSRAWPLQKKFLGRQHRTEDGEQHISYRAELCCRKCKRAVALVFGASCKTSIGMHTFRRTHIPLRSRGGPAIRPSVLQCHQLWFDPRFSELFPEFPAVLIDVTALEAL